MPSFQSVVLTDRTTPTPVNFTFTPREIDANGVAVTANNTGVPVGEKRATVSSRKRNNRYVGEVRLILPVVANETINGVTVPVVQRTAYVTLSTTFDEKSTEQERNDAIGLMASALGTGKVLINDTLVKLEGVW